MKSANRERDEFWPPLPFAEWRETAATLHMWTQIVGKIRLIQTPWINHSWHVTLYVTSRGLTTSPIPHGLFTFEIVFDFIDHQFQEFRSRFCGKCSPVHFFWGSFDLAVTRFSGRPAPAHPGGVPHLPDEITREAYSQEVSSLGFWPGNANAPMPIFYSYAYPESPGFADAKIQPEAASYHKKLREFILPYDAVRTAESPDEVLLNFAQSTYDAASVLGKWDRGALEEKKPVLHSPR